ncbi:MAG: 50S ribosomal protein L22 [Candidatus Actinomarina sp.]|jgi:large subunit ribosomal protein L22|nr:50S ribosomal protein L22 [Actinomycetota bacterium]MDC3033276.1 50S ribosomal protein L22 [Acidimicrobiaceae bacterium]MDC3103716.1 50S ribosomal protein L22 [Acidimicrobiaceae bacterium]MDC3226654.1 50S ribosomal protein L22 [Acidimicrobiaceae bacterium]|tara:strand:- start:567 stop:914 length:348 start_codon:yes stop_codon:yes gene_type:complete
MENETITAKSKYIRQSPYKLRLVLNLIRGLPVSEALDILKFTKRKASDEITKVIQSAMANAENNFGLNSNDLYISKAIADEGPTLKRFRPRARGRAGRINKRTSHLIIELASTGE